MEWYAILGLIALGVALCVEGFYAIMMLALLGFFRK
jgi:hypothetical protein